MVKNDVYVFVDRVCCIRVPITWPNNSWSHFFINVFCGANIFPKRYAVLDIKPYRLVRYYVGDYELMRHAKIAAEFTCLTFRKASK